LSYCVNCGVELAKSEAKCPLCETPVQNPADPEQGHGKKPYPETLEFPKARVKKRLIALLVALILLIPIAVCIFADAQQGGGLSWSLVVAGGELLLFMIVFGPFLFRVWRPVLCTLLDGAGILLFLFLLSRLSEGDWFWTLGLPIATAGTALTALLAGIVLGRKRFGILFKVGSALIAAGVFCVFIEFMLTRYLDAVSFTGWSIYVLIPCVLTGIVAMILNFSAAAKDQIKRRFFV